MNKIKFIITTIVLCLCASSAMAQQRITGRVWSEIDGPVMLANVVERDANNRIVEACVTDMNGNFSMVVKNPKDKLVVSYIGYKTWSEVIGNRTKFDIKMQDNTMIQEVVIKAKPKVQSNGMSIPLKEISVATQTMNMDDVEGLSFASADEALQGKIAGLDIISNSGNLGAGTSMRMRGVSTINGSAEPLIVVDGNIFDLPSDATDINFEDLDNEEQFSTLLSVNPEDIKDIKVLKDAAATAIWGSRGANGVIEITTRRGVSGKTRINLSYRFTGAWQPEGLSMLNGDGYTMMMKEAYFNPLQSTASSNMVELNYDQSRPVYYNNFNKNTDWVDAVNQFGQTHNYYVTLTGGGEKARFRISGGYDHQTGTIIKQELDRFSTRLVLDYDVSDRIRFSTNFGLTYTDNKRNWDGGKTTTILDRAYKAMPNMSIYEYDERGNLTGDFYKMLPSADSYTITPDGYSSRYLSDLKDNGNPVAMAHQAFNNQSTYRITPQFNLKYKLLGKDDESHQLNLDAEVYMDIYNESVNTYYPSTLTTNDWASGVNGTSNYEYKSLAFTNRETLVFIPKFNNEDWSMSAMGRFEFTSGSSSNQNLAKNGIPSGLSSAISQGYITGTSTGTSEWRSASFIGSFHVAYKDGTYAADVTVRGDGSTKFGAGNKWGAFPGVSARWNISQEPFFEPLTKVVSMLAVRPGWGRVGRQPSHEYLMYNTYGDYGIYGTSSKNMTAINPQNLRLTELKWETTDSWNLGFNLNLFDDLLQFDLNIYNKKTKDLLMQGVGVPGSSGFGALTWKNVGELENKGWELYMNTGKFLKKGKFYMTASFNIAQNINTITAMDATVLATMNPDYDYKNANYLQRIQVGNAVGSIYGFKYKGVYRYDYDHNGFSADSYNTYGDNTAAAAAARGENATCPVVRDANGNVVFDAKGNPLKMYFNYGGVSYAFDGGDVIYEDINNDGQINELDIVYLGNSNPKFNGGFGLNFNYSAWTLKLSFNYRFGNKVVNMTRLNNESMRSNINQSQAVSWRWRKNGDITEIPRALNSGLIDSYNALGSDRYVEKGDYLRLQYAQLSYNVPSKVVKNWGLQSLRVSASANNLFCWTKYTGVDPEVSYGSWGVCYDNSKTPRSKSFTLSLNVGF
ncbi:MAG: SusC/RagA family TonB-linked outer membrane protein [Bacteroides sp.]|nr:SusC/RagA family TonB-linked outer membrane protein [Roseburia sp.]MCM1346205.1 SusC/RagA family TonB-linked outer membrane protein [Bacteroides sp.]MCM1419968.1 SusC/RagA family TonB-linked outer membrane protein [Bacteroides sp.]